MIPSINAMILCASVLRKMEADAQLDALCLSRLNNAKSAIAAGLQAHDLWQVATFLDEQIKLRTPKKRKAVIRYAAAEPKAK